MLDRDGRHKASSMPVRVLVAGALCVLLAVIVAVVPAIAGTTSLSTFTKSATDPTTGSSATAGGAAGSTRAGDTINWVLGYQNNTNSTAGVGIVDQITGNQGLVAGSVVGPPSLRVTCPFPASVTCSKVPATGGGVDATGTIPGPATAASGALATGQVNFTTQGGDGYSIEGQGGDIYTVFHHTSLSTTVFCATLSNQICQGWPANSTYVDPTPGTSLGQGTSGGYSTGDVNGSFIANGKLFWPEEANSPSGGTYPLGIQCLDLTSQTSCGFTQLDTATLAPAGTGTANRAVGRIAGDGIAAADGDYYMFDGNGKLLCFNPATNAACGSFAVTGGATVHDPGAGAMTNILTLGSHIFLTFIASGSSNEELTCFDVTTSSLCGGSSSPFPIVETAAASAFYADFVAPVLSANGTPLGACDVAKHRCVDPSGAALADPYPSYSGFGFPGSAVGFGSGAIVGSRFYAGDMLSGRIDCFDFGARVGGGAVPACSGYAGPADGNNYTVRALANLPGCLAADGDAAQIVVFDQQSGGTCETASAQVTVKPAAYYCDGQSGHAQHWGTLTLSGLTGSEFSGGSVTLVGPNGPVAGYTNVSLAPGQTSLDLSSLPVSGNTATLTADVTLTGVTNAAAVQAASMVLSFSGDPVQICFQTKVGSSTCEPTPVIANNATATTSAGTVSDASTGGNGSGTVSFNEAPDTSLCHPSMTIQKIADAALGDQTPIKVGERIQYSYLVTNTGNVSIPTVSVNDPTVKGGVSCPQPPAPGLAPNQSETCTANAAYVVTQGDVDKGGADDTATVSCSDRYGDACPPAPSSSTHVPSAPAPSVAIDKIATVTPSADQNAAKVGDSIQYTYRVTNNGNVSEPAISVNDPTAGQVRCPVPAAPGLAPGQSLTCTAVATHAVTQADVDGGAIVDTATAGCTDTQGRSCPKSSPSTAKVPTVAPDPQVSIQKIANASGGDTSPITLGETVQYSYLVRNTGNITISSVSVSDPTGGAVTCPTPAAPGLAPGQSVLCEASAPYTVTQADVDAGRVTDTATAGCSDINGGACPPELPSSVTVPSNPTPEVAIDKTGSASPASDQNALQAGDTIAYSYIVTNVGNVDLNAVSVDDPTIGAVTCPSIAAPGLAPGASVTCLADSVHHVTQSDVDAGSVGDTATAGCSPAAGGSCAPSNVASVLIPTLAARPLTEVVKTATVIPAADHAHVRVGDRIRYSFKVTNVGNVDLKTVAVSDPALGPTSCPTLRAPGLRPGASLTCIGKRLHTVNRTDLRHGKIINTATSTGTDPRGQTSAVSRQSKVTMRVTKPRVIKRRLKLIKVASNTHPAPGQNVTYTLRLTNPGPATVTKVTVCDRLPSTEALMNASPRSRLNDGRHCWSLHRLAGHQIRMFKITVNIEPGLPGSSRIDVNHASASARGVHTVTARATVHVHTPPAIGPGS